MATDVVNAEAEAASGKNDGKAVDQWRSNALNICNSFVFETSVHGLKYIAAKDRAKLRRTLWLLLVVAMTTWLVYTLQSLYGRYLQYPYFTSLTAVHHDRLPLPAISLCLRNPVHRSRLIGLPHGQGIERLFFGDVSHLFDNATFRDAMSRLTFAELMDKVSFGLDEVVKATSFGALGVHYDTLPRAAFAVHNMQVSILGRPKRCFTFGEADNRPSEPSWIYTMDVYEEWRTYLTLQEQNVLTFDDVGGVYLIVHSPWEIPVVDMGINISPGSAVTILIKSKQIRFLPAPYKSMGGRDCVQTQDPNFRSPLRYFGRYSYGNCIFESAIKDAAEACNCTILFPDGLQVPDCSILQYYSCFQEKMGLGILHAEQTCQRECVRQELAVRLGSAVPFPRGHALPALTQLNLTNDHTGLQDLIRVLVKFESTSVDITEHNASLTMDNIYSVVGGQMGLFLGASLLTVLELLEWLLCLLWSAVVHLTCRGQRNAART